MTATVQKEQREGLRARIFSFFTGQTLGERQALEQRCRRASSKIDANVKARVLAKKAHDRVYAEVNEKAALQQNLTETVMLQPPRT